MAGQGLAVQRPDDSFSGRVLVPDREVRGAEGVVGQAAAGLGEELRPQRQGLLHIVNGVNEDSGGLSQLFEISRIARVRDVQCLLRAEGGQHPDVKGRARR